MTRTRKLTIAALATGLLVGMGCASSTKIERGAYEHFEKARQLEAEGDYGRAEKEREAGRRQLRKAQDRARYENGTDYRYRYY
jgi:outer membrane murein-binding lipoprotein Lpp